MKHHKNLSQFLDARQAAEPYQAWVHLLPDGRALASTHLAMAQYATEPPKGLKQPCVVTDGKAFLKTLSDKPEHELTWRKDVLTVAWEKRIAQPPVELTDEDGKITKIPQPPLFEAQQAEYNCPRRLEGPKIEQWLEHWQNKPAVRRVRTGIRADQAKQLAGLKQGHLKSKDEPANFVVTLRDGGATFYLPDCAHSFCGALTTNSLTGDTQ